MNVTVSECRGLVAVRAEGCPPCLLSMETARIRVQLLLDLIVRASPGRLVDVRLLTGTKLLLPRWNADALCEEVWSCAANLRSALIGREEEAATAAEPVATHELGGESGTA